MPRRPLTRPALAVLLIGIVAWLTGCPERPPPPRTAGGAPSANVSPSASLRGLPDFTHLVEGVGPAVVSVTALATGAPSALPRFLSPPPESREERPMRGLASGVIISADGYVLTNAHVVENADAIIVRLPEPGAEYSAAVVGRDARTDIALLKIAATGLPYARIGSSQRLKVGEWVVAIGSPFGFDSTLTAGVVSAKGRRLPDGSNTPFLQTDVAVNPGNSGGPLLNLAGEVVGINSTIYTRTGGYMGVSFAIPIEVALKVGDELREHGFVARGRIGVVVRPVTDEIAGRAGLGRPQGAEVTAVEPGGPAETAGISVGDILLKFGGRTVANDSELSRLVADAKPGTRSRIDVWREGRGVAAQVDVAAAPRDS